MKFYLTAQTHIRRIPHITLIQDTPC